MVFTSGLQSDGNPISVGAPRNPVAQLSQRNNSSHATRTIANVQFDYKMHFLPELRANLNLGVDMSRSNGDDNTSNSASSIKDGEIFNTTNHYEQTKDNKLMDFYLDYAKDLPSLNSSVDFMAGYSYQNFLNEGFNNSVTATR